MSKPRDNDLKIQVYRSTAMQLAHEWLRESPEDWLKKGIDPERIRYDFITPQALDLSYLWGSEEGFPWEEIPTWRRKDRKGSISPFGTISNYVVCATRPLARVHFASK